MLGPTVTQQNSGRPFSSRHLTQMRWLATQRPALAPRLASTNVCDQRITVDDDLDSNSGAADDSNPTCRESAIELPC